MNAIDLMTELVGADSIGWIASDGLADPLVRRYSQLAMKRPGFEVPVEDELSLRELYLIRQALEPRVAVLRQLMGEAQPHPADILSGGANFPRWVEEWWVEHLLHPWSERLVNAVVAAEIELVGARE